MRGSALTAVLLALTCAVTFAAAPALEGDWVLVEQSYGGGRANLPVSPGVDDRLMLEVRRDGGVLEARVRVGGAGTPAKADRAWPAWQTDDGPLPLELLERSVEASTKVLRARYRVRPSANGDTVLEVVEHYRLDGEALVGTVHVTLRLDDEPRGSYVLHRRFERAP